MKKNLMTVIILALVLVNLVLTAILAFTIIPQTRKSNQLIDKIASAIDLELEDGSSKDTAAVPVEDIEASFTVNLSPSGDGKDHVAVFSIGLSLNTKSDGYKSIGTEGLKAKETLIKNDINTIVSGYTMEQFREDEQSVKDAILEDLQEMFGSDFIVGVSFSSVNTQ
jgi:flagellar basal body-associated protein FliL